jgi:hypothetical protein
MIPRLSTRGTGSQGNSPDEIRVRGSHSTDPEGCYPTANNTARSTDEPQERVMFGDSSSGVSLPYSAAEPRRGSGEADWA